MCCEHSAQARPHSLFSQRLSPFRRNPPTFNTYAIPSRNPFTINTCISASFQTTYNPCRSHTCKPPFSQLLPLQHMRKKELRSARRHCGVRRLAAAFTDYTVPPNESFGRNGWHRKSGSNLPHPKGPRRKAAGLPPQKGRASADSPCATCGKSNSGPSPQNTADTNDVPSPHLSG